MVTGMVADMGGVLDGVTFSLNVTSTFTTSVGPQRLLAQPVLLNAMPVMVGAVASRVKLKDVDVAVLPAMSVAVAV